MQTRPNIYIVCMHKGASTFVAQNLFPTIEKRVESYQRYYLDRIYVDWFNEKKEELQLAPTEDWAVITQRISRMFEDHPLPRSNALVGRFYPNHIPAVCNFLQDEFPPKNSKVIVMRRDPRDALVSLYFSTAFSHNPKAMETKVTDFHDRRKEIRQVGVKSWIKHQLLDEERNCVVNEFSKCVDILNNHNGVCDLPYELLIDDSRNWLEKFVEHTGLGGELDENWFGQMETHLKPPQVVDHMQHKRRMKPGNWKEVFDDELKSILDSQIGSQMNQLDYCW